MWLFVKIFRSLVVIIIIIIRRTDDLDIEVFETCSRCAEVECRRLITLNHVKAVTSRHRLARVDDVDVEWRTYEQPETDADTQTRRNKQNEIRL